MISAFKIWHGQPPHLNRRDFQTVSRRCSSRVSRILLPQVLTLLPSACSTPTRAVLWCLGMVRSKTSRISPGVWCLWRDRTALGRVYPPAGFFRYKESGLSGESIYSPYRKADWYAADTDPAAKTFISARRLAIAFLTSSLRDCWPWDFRN